MSNVFFKPWVGNQYDKAGSIFSKKILVLGDSHYIDEQDYISLNNLDEQSDLTTGVMLDYLDPNVKENWKSTFTKFMNSFIQDTKHYECSISELWNSVAFYNYLQRPGGTQSRQTQHYDYTQDKDRNAFLEIINDLQPDIIISWGNKVWDAIPEDLGYGNYRVNDLHGDCCCLYPFKDRVIKLIGITHPSTSYKSSHWSKVFCELRANS
jgi:hypothetical protein